MTARWWGNWWILPLLIQINLLPVVLQSLSYFFFPDPIVSSSKLRRESSRPPLAAGARVNDDDFNSKPGWILWVVDRRPLPETSRLERLSVGSPEELGRLLDTIALFEVLPFREELRGLSDSACWNREFQFRIMGKGLRVYLMQS